MIKSSTYRTADEGYNSTLRYEKNGSYSTCKPNNSTFPTIVIPCFKSWEGHSESILSLTSLNGSKMIATTAADCKLRLWAAADTTVGIRDYEAGALFGEIDTMDYQEQRFERLEHWNCPTVGGAAVSEEHRTIAKSMLYEVKAEEEATRRRQSLLRSLPPELLLMQGSPTHSNNSSSPTSKNSSRMGRRRSSSYQESRASIRKQKAPTEKERSVRNALRAVKKKKKASNNKRASIIMTDDNTNAAFMELFDEDKKILQEEERLKRSKVKRIVEDMRLTLRTANNSKTRGGKVIYGHLYGELKEKERERMMFKNTDTSMSDFAEKRLKEEVEAKKKKGEEERMIRKEEHEARKAWLKKKYQEAELAEEGEEEEEGEVLAEEEEVEEVQPEDGASGEEPQADDDGDLEVRLDEERRTAGAKRQQYTAYSFNRQTIPPSLLSRPSS